MIQTQPEYEATMERIALFRRQIEYLRKTETKPQ